jgi:Outer membrane protein beta-barrel domain
MRVFLCVALLAIATPARADSFVDIFGGLSLPTADDDWTDTAESSPKLGLRLGSVPHEIGGFLQADWVPTNTDAQSATFPGGSTDISAHRFRIGAGALLHHPISNTLVVTGRGGIGIDIAHVSASYNILGATGEVSDTDVGLGLEFGAGLFFHAGNLEIGGELGIPIGFHDHDGGTDRIQMKWTSVDIDLLFCVRFLSH